MGSTSSNLMFYISAVHSNGGHTWTITFYEQTDAIPPLRVVDGQLTGSSARGYAVVLNQPPSKVRSVVHAFKLDAACGRWIEQAFLFPSVPQKQVGVLYRSCSDVAYLISLTFYACRIFLALI
jgi:hypothetical protein